MNKMGLEVCSLWYDSKKCKTTIGVAVSANVWRCVSTAVVTIVNHHTAVLNAWVLP